MRFKVLHIDTPSHVKLGDTAEMPAAAYALARKYEEAGAKNVEIIDTESDPHTKLNWQDFARARPLTPSADSRLRCFAAPARA